MKILVTEVRQYFIEVATENKSTASEMARIDEISKFNAAKQVAMMMVRGDLVSDAELLETRAKSLRASLARTKTDES